MLAEFVSNIFSSVNETTILVFALVALVAWWYYSNRDLPPGPWGLPILGYLPYLKSPPDAVLHNLCKKYGNVISMKLGTSLVVVLGNYETIKEAFVKQGDNFSGRPLGRILKTLPDEQGVVASHGEIWKDHRRFILSNLRDYGMGKLSLEPEIMSEIHYFLEELSHSNGQPYELRPLLGVSTANVISAMVFGKRFAYSDLRFAQLRRMLDRIAQLFSSVQARGFFPEWTQHIPLIKSLTGDKEMTELASELRAFFIDMAEEHKAMYVENSKKDYIDAYITEQTQHIKKLGNEGNFGQIHLLSNMLNLYGAGTETTTSTLRWGFLYMATFPEIQKKVQKEIDDVVGMERAPSMSDRNRMTYTEAVLLETQRCGSVIPLNLVHSNFEEAWIGGYRIPKQTKIITNLAAVHQDPNLWDKPEEFVPERFISKDGKLEKIEYLIPFGIGKRVCLGESLARMELFLYFTSILQRFSLSAPKGSLPSIHEYEFGIARQPKPYKVCLLQRSGYHVT